MLSVIPTPIGNLKDISIRAIETLKNCDVVFCEDTRRSLKLLSAYNISKKVLRYNDHIEKTISQCFSFLQEGKKVCLLTDGGMPIISDPGWKIIKKARENQIPVEILPGPSSLTVAIAGAGIPADAFVFLGFLPRSSGKILKILNKAFLIEKPIVLYESPYRIKKLLELLKNNYKNLNVIIARELTKVFEQWLYGTVEEISEKIKNEDIKGEITVILFRDRKEDIIPPAKEKKILFVCTGNTCRSVLAQYYFNKIAKEQNIEFVASSAGIYVNQNIEVPEPVINLLKRENIKEDIKTEHKPTQITYDIAEKANVILTMTAQQKKILKGFLPDFEDKIFQISEYSELGIIDITDPYGTSEINYEMAFKTIKNMVNLLVEKLKLSESKSEIEK